MSIIENLITDAGPIVRYKWELTNPKYLGNSHFPWGAVIPTIARKLELTNLLIDNLLSLNVRVIVLDNRTNPQVLRNDVHWEPASYPFNYGKLMNHGARILWGMGPCNLLFLNDDIQWDKESMATFLCEGRAGVFGAVMPNLLNPDGTTQGRGAIARTDGSGVVVIKGPWEGTEAHMLCGPVIGLRGALYEAGVRWREDLRITHSDNALSLDVREKGYAIGALRDIPVIHWEKSSRGPLGDPPEDAAIFWANYWQEILKCIPGPSCRVHKRPMLDPEMPLKVAVIKLDHIGDIALVKDSILRLKERLPKADITIFCATWAQCLFKSWGYKTIPVDIWTEGGVLSQRIGFSESDKARTASAGTFDLAVDLRAGSEAREVLHAVNATYKVAYGEGWTWSLPDSLQHTMSNKDQIRLLVERIAVLKPKISRGRFIGLNKSATGAAKAWPTERWTELENWLRNHGIPYKWYDQNTVPLEKFQELVANECRVYIGCDTGPTHLVAEAGVPVVELIGGLVLVDEWMAYGRVLGLGQQTPCSPCYSPNGRGCGIKCMDISVQDVLWAIGAII